MFASIKNCVKLEDYIPYKHIIEENDINLLKGLTSLKECLYYGFGSNDCINIDSLTKEFYHNFAELFNSEDICILQLYNSCY